MPDNSASVPKIGLLNMMADKALRATERQFNRLLRIPGKEAHPEILYFSIPQLDRSEQAQEYIHQNYHTWSQIQSAGIQALVITGTNLSDPRLDIQPFWEPLISVVDWAWGARIPVLCSCLATHAVLEFKFGQKRGPLGQKLWGVFDQEKAGDADPLTRGLPAHFPVPHSRHNDVSHAQYQAAGLRILISGGGAGVHLATDKDHLLVLMQGHPEYDDISLLKEFKREVGLFASGQRPDYPPVPVNYFAPSAGPILSGHRLAVSDHLGSESIPKGVSASPSMPAFPEEALTSCLSFQWRDPAAQVFANWLGLVLAID